MGDVSGVRLVLCAAIFGACGGSAARAPDPAAPGAAASETAAAESIPGLRLPGGAAPLAYDLELEIDPGAPRFAGRVEIALRLAVPARTLWLHGKALTVESAEVQSGAQTVGAQASAHGTDLLRIDLERPVAAGEATLRVRYGGELSDQTSYGAYVMRGGDQPYVLTQLENTEARRVTPCFDEPGQKTPWQLTLVIPEDLVAFSNTPIIDVTEEGAKKRVRFAQTPPLPSYLLAFAVGAWEHVPAGKTPSGVPLGVITPRGRAAEARFTARHTAEWTGRLEEYFGVPYPYAKLDNLGRPDGQGAMENAGLIISGGAVILADPATESADFRKRAAAVTAHEIAHMWFGDLVTMAWWDDLWLNEAFATWLAAKTFAVRPDLKVEQERAEYRSHAMAADVSTAARQIRQPIASADDIENAFDAITYDKGAAVLRMMERHVGEAAFQKGVNDYLTTHAHQNATTADFVAAISTAAGRDVAAVFASFVDRPGLPAVDMALRCEGGKGIVALAQRRFLSLGVVAPGAEQPWRVPVCVEGEGGATVCTLLTAASGQLELPSCPRWIHGNPAGAGYYLPVYAGDLLEKLVAAAGALSLEEQLALAGDLELAITAGSLPADRGLAAVEKLARGAGPELTLRLVELVDELADRALVDDATRPAFARWVVRTFGARARALGWAPKGDEPDTVRRLRPELLALVAIHGREPRLGAEGRKVAARWIGDRGAADPDAVRGALRVAAAAGDASFVARLRGILSRGDSVERQQVIKTLLEVTDPAALRASLGLFLDGTLHSRDFRYFKTYDNPSASRDEMLRFVREHFDGFVARLPEPVQASLLHAGRASCDEAAAKEYAAAFGARAGKLLGGPRVFAQQKERIETCAAVRAAQAPRVASFLRGAR